MLSLVVTKSLFSFLLPPPPAMYPLPWLYHGSTMALIDSVVATMVIATGPHLLRARTTINKWIHHLLRRSEVSRTFERTSTQELLFSSSIKIKNNYLAVQNMSQVYMSHILNWRLDVDVLCWYIFSILTSN